MNPSTTTTWKYLAPNPKSSYKQLYVRGTRIPARALYGWYAGPEPYAPEFIADSSTCQSKPCWNRLPIANQTRRNCWRIMLAMKP